MADQTEIKKVISVDVGNTTTSLKEYKKHIEELRGSLLQLDETSEEYAKIAQEIKNEQDKLNQVMKVGKNATDAADGSYDKLTQTMAELKKQWRATADETERAELGEKILDINNQLKQLDASTGNFQRNVGDYENAFSSSMSQLKDGISSNIPVVGKLGGAFTKLATNPITAAIGGLVLVLKKAKEAINSNEEATFAMAEAMSWSEPIVNEFKNSMNDLGNSIVKFTGKWSESIKQFYIQLRDTYDQLGLKADAGEVDKLLDKMEQSKRLAIEANDLIKDRRTLNEDNAKIEQKISELRFKVYDTENYTAEQRLEFAKQMQELDRKEAQAKLTYAQRELALLEERATLTANSTEDEEALSQARIKVTNLQTELNTKLTSSQKLIMRISKEAGKIEKTTGSIKEDVEEISEDLLKLANEEISLDPIKAPEEVQLTLEKTKEIVKTAQRDLKDELDQDKFTLSLVEDTMTTQEKLTANYELQQNYLLDSIKINEQLLEDDRITAKEREQLLYDTDKLRKEMANNTLLYNKQIADANKKADDEEIKRKKMMQAQVLTATANLFGALSDLSEQNSTEQKAFAVMETTINTLQSIMGVTAAMAGKGPAGWALGAIQIAANIATGAATVKKILSTNKSSKGSSLSGAQATVTSSPAGAAVTPLLDEEADISRMTTLPETGNSSKEQNIRVYVVDQDIRDANYRAQVIDNNVTF